MAVELVEPDRGGPRLLGHAKPVSAPGLGVALADAVRRPVMCAPSRSRSAWNPPSAITTAPASTVERPSAFRIFTPRHAPPSMTRASASVPRRIVPPAAPSRASRLRQKEVRAVPFPVQPGAHPPGGRKTRQAVIAPRGGFQRGAVLLHPGDGALSVLRESPREIGARGSPGRAHDALVHDVRRIVRGRQRGVDHAGANPRIAHVGLAFAALDRRGHETELGCADRGYEPRETASDRRQIDLHYCPAVDLYALR